MPADPSDLSDDMVLTTTDAARVLKAHRATVCEWLTKGVAIRGTVVRLRGRGQREPAADERAGGGRVPPRLHGRPAG